MDPVTSVLGCRERLALRFSCWGFTLFAPFFLFPTLFYDGRITRHNLLHFLGIGWDARRFILFLFFLLRIVYIVLRLQMPVGSNVLISAYLLFGVVEVTRQHLLHLLRVLPENTTHSPRIVPVPGQRFCFVFLLCCNTFARRTNTSDPPDPAMRSTCQRQEQRCPQGGISTPPPPSFSDKHHKQPDVEQKTGSSFLAYSSVLSGFGLCTPTQVSLLSLSLCFCAPLVSASL